MVPEKPAYFSRFALKFAEILGAGIATAVSGYLVAHLGGYLSWPAKAPAPTVAIEAPAGGNARTPDRPRDRAAVSAPADTHAASDDRAKETRSRIRETCRGFHPGDNRRRSRGQRRQALAWRVAQARSRRACREAYAARNRGSQGAGAGSSRRPGSRRACKCRCEPDAGAEYADAPRRDAHATNGCNTSVAANSCAGQSHRSRAGCNYGHIRSAARRRGGAGSTAARHSKCRACRSDHAEPTCCRVSVATTDSSGGGSADYGRD